jgi:hypothetical protein
MDSAIDFVCLLLRATSSHRLDLAASELAPRLALLGGQRPSWRGADVKRVVSDPRGSWEFTWLTCQPHRVDVLWTRRADDLRKKVARRLDRVRPAAAGCARPARAAQPTGVDGDRVGGAKSAWSGAMPDSTAAPSARADSARGRRDAALLGHSGGVLSALIPAREARTFRPAAGGGAPAARVHPAWRRPRTFRVSRQSGGS